MLLGLSLISGTLIRLSTLFGMLLMLMFYFAHMEWPYNESRFYYVVGPHLIYAAILLYLLIKRAGNFWGIDGLLIKLR